MDIELADILQFKVSDQDGAAHPYRIPCLEKVAQLPVDPADVGYPYKVARVRRGAPGVGEVRHRDNLSIPCLSRQVRDMVLEEIEIFQNGAFPFLHE